MTATTWGSAPLRLLLGSAWFDNGVTWVMGQLPSHSQPNLHLSSVVALQGCALSFLASASPEPVRKKDNVPLWWPVELPTHPYSWWNGFQTVTDNDIQGSSCLWFPTELFSQAARCPRWPCTCFCYCHNQAINSLSVRGGKLKLTIHLDAREHLIECSAGMYVCVRVWFPACSSLSVCTPVTELLILDKWQPFWTGPFFNID